MRALSIALLSIFAVSPVVALPVVLECRAERAASCGIDRCAAGAAPVNSMGHASYIRLDRGAREAVHCGVLEDGERPLGAGCARERIEEDIDMRMGARMVVLSGGNVRVGVVERPDGIIYTMTRAWLVGSVITAGRCRPVG